MTTSAIDNNLVPNSPISYVNNEAKVKKFALTESLIAQMNKIMDLRSTNPAKSNELMLFGDGLCEMAKKGELRNMVTTINSLLEDEFIPHFFLCKMLKESLYSGHLMVATYIIDNGYPIQNGTLPSALHYCLEIVEDYRAVDIIQLYVAKGYDINTQISPTWFTALHMAVKYQLPESVELLLRLGSDVNAVAKDDILPLTLAEIAINERTESVSAEGEETEEAAGITNNNNASIALRIHSLLLEKGALPSWRKSNHTSNEISSTSTSTSTFSTHSYSTFMTSSSATTASTPSNLPSEKKIYKKFSHTNTQELSSLSLQSNLAENPLLLLAPPSPNNDSHNNTRPECTTRSVTFQTSGCSQSQSQSATASVPPLPPTPADYDIDSTTRTVLDSSINETYSRSDDGGFIFSTGN